MNTEDRRAPGVARIAFDGLVEVGGTLGPSFEAHAVNVSEEGMQLRTAYLPELGQQVTCRFEGTSTRAHAGDAVVGSGEVVWCRAAEQGGEFGLRFTEMDAECVEALKRVCGFDGDSPLAQPGGKVRLFIEGLASPMRAKVREARASAITVGSDLGFLQVGKQLELEDAQSGRKRPASIDRVEVAVDPTSHVPQLIVTLRYADAAAGDTSRTDATGAPGEARASDPEVTFDDSSARMKGMLASQAARVGPAFERIAHRVKTTIALLAQRKRAEDDAPRRTTAPAPGGGLRSSGRRVVRADASGATEGHPSHVLPTQARSGPGSRRAAIAAAVMATAVLGAVAIKRTHHESPQPSANAPAASDTAVTVAGTPPAPAAPAAAAHVPELPTADTTTAVAPAPSVPASGAPPAPAPAAPPNDKAGAATATSDDGDDAARKKHPRATPFANGPVHHGNILRLKMDGPVESIEGAQQPTGFAVKLPGRRSLEAAAPLAARDSRIATIKITNEPSGAELTVAFKDGVPNYRVSARGDSLVIAIAPVGPLSPVESSTIAKRDERATKGSKHARVRDSNPER